MIIGSKVEEMLHTVNDTIGHLMHDFGCKNADDIHYEELKKSVRHFKEEGGRDIMCKAIEEYGNERAQASALETKVDNVKNLMDTLKLTLDQAMQALKITAEEQQLIRTLIN